MGDKNKSTMERTENEEEEEVWFPLHIHYQWLWLIYTHSRAHLTTTHANTHAHTNFDTCKRATEMIEMNTCTYIAISERWCELKHFAYASKKMPHKYLQWICLHLNSMTFCMCVCVLFLATNFYSIVHFNRSQSCCIYR